MASQYSFLMCTLLLSMISLCFYGIYAAPNYVVTVVAPKHPGSVKFNNIIGGIPATKELMGKINTYVWGTVFKQNTPADRKPLNTIKVFIKDFKGAAGLTWEVYNIDISAVYLELVPAGDLKWEFISLMYHEMTHVLQWSGEGKCPGSLTEGIADYTILKANYYPPDFAKPGSGNKWDQGYGETARFLEYCDSLVPDFVAKLNKMMRKTYDVSFFKNLTGKPVEQLWKDYKAKYAGKKTVEGK